MARKQIISRSRELLGQANEIREKGKYVESLQLADEAISLAQKDNEPLIISEALAVRYLAYKLLFQDTNDFNYLFLAKHTMLASVEIAEKSNIKSALAIPYFNLAKVLDEVGEVSESLSYFKKALDVIKSNPPESHNRPGVLADFAGYVATQQYKAGDKSAIKLIDEAIENLKNSGEDKISDYNLNVWLSGIHMRTAELLKDDDPKLSKKHLAQAKEIIQSDERLSIRMKQWERLSARLMAILISVAPLTAISWNFLFLKHA